MQRLMFMLDESTNLCGKLSTVWTIFGYIVFAIQIVVPLLLIIFGMLSMAKAITQEKEDDIKKAQDLLIKRLIAAAIVFLLILITKIVLGAVIGEDDKQSWESCVHCALDPFDSNGGCGVMKGEFIIPEIPEEGGEQ